MLQKDLKKYSRSGFSLLEVMIASGIITTIVGTVTVFITRSNDQLAVKSAKMEQARLYSMIKSDLMKLPKIQESIIIDSSGTSAILKKCLETNNASTQDCDVTDPAGQLEFNFRTKLGGVNQQRTGAVNYSLNGIRACTSSMPHCPFWTAHSYFWATCPGNTAKCDQASNINIRFILKPVKSTFKDLGLNSLPDENEFNAPPKTAFTITHNLQTGRNQIGDNQDCPAGAQMSGLDPNGKIKCECRAGFKNTELDPTKPPICVVGVTTCLPNQRIKGRNADGTVACVNVVPVCKNITFNDEDATCPVGGWLENINLGYCKPGPKNKKGTDRGIKCDINQGKCCYYDEI